MELNTEQRNAVQLAENACIRACPGSGKTRTIIAKLLRAIEDVKGTARRIACITYTHAAVDEIELRLKEHGIGDDDTYCEVSTIHSFCLNNVLQPFHYMIKAFTNGFSIISPESEEWFELISGLASVYGVGRDMYDSFALIHRRPDGSVFVPGEIPDEAANDLLTKIDGSGLVSFSDIVYHSIQLLRAHRFIARGLSARFGWILVDEFQDTTDGQVIVLRRIAAHGKTRFFLVGDPNQSIMRFAGAYPELMTTFPDEIGALDRSLRGNYRCSGTIVDHAERLIPSAPPMQAVGPDACAHTAPQLFIVESPTIGIVEHFLPALESENIRLGDAAVLAPWWLPLYHLGRELRDFGIAVYGPGSRPYKRSHLFAGLAETLCAYAEESSPELFRRANRALFNMILNLTGVPDWRVFSYAGRVCVCSLAHIAKAGLEEYGGGAIRWLREVAREVAGLLTDHEFLPSEKAHLIRASVEDMVHDMRRNRVDTANLSVTDLGLYAKPRDCLQLITMHSSKGREFEAVALIDLHNGRIPHFRSSTSEEVDDARRLLYVSITRARKILMYFVDTSNPRNEASPFLREMGLPIDE